MNKKRILVAFIIATIFLSVKNVYALDANDYKNRNLCGNFEVAGFHDDGGIFPVGCLGTYEEAREYMKNYGAIDLSIMTKVNGVTKIIDSNAALLDLSVNPETLTYFYNDINSKSAYTYMDTGSLYGGVDGAHIDTAYSSTRNKWMAKVRIGNYTGWIEQQAYEIVPFTWIKSMSSYTVTSESIRHNYVAKIQNYYNGSGGRTIGPKPDMLTPGKYYSYDGHYFYRDLATLISDYKNNNYNNSVNKSSPYYNYYMYLSNHTRTSYSSTNIDEYIRNNLGIKKNAYGNASDNGSSRLYGMGTFFYYAQEKYGVNAILSLSLSRNETGNGTSNLAINKNNGFGLNAVDSNPTQAANWYASFSSSILGYASKWITYGYAHPRDWRYFGPQFGDKWIGMNVKYASDTYWSEKMAANYYQLDSALGLQDYNYYQLGVVNGPTNAYQEPSASSKLIYTYPEAEDGLVIVDEITRNNEKWYKVVSDLNIDGNYNEITSGDYNWNGYVYVPASNVKKINKGKNGNISPNNVTAYQNKNYQYNLYVENTELKPRVAITTKNTNYFYDSALTSPTGNTLLKDRYVMVYTAAYLNNQPVAYLVTSDYWYDQKEWVSADSLKFTNTSYGKVSVTVSGNQYTWVNYNTDDAKYSLISGLYTNSYVPVLETVNANGSQWYKVPVSLTNNNNVYGYTLASAPGVAISLSTPVVENNTPVISAADKTIIEGTTFNERDGVTASDIEDGNLTSKIKITSNNVNTNKPGVYNVTYQVTDTAGNTATKTIKVTVKENKAPVISAEDKIFTQNKKYNALEGVTAIDSEDGDLTSSIKVVEDTVNIKVIGTYKIVYEVTDKNNKKTTKEIKVEVVKDRAPVINATDQYVFIDEDFDELEDVTATDPEDGNLTSKIKVIENTVDTSKIGDYKVTYQVTDSANNTTKKTIEITVVDDISILEDMEEKDALFYFDSLKVVNKKLTIKGYNAIKGINNTLDTDLGFILVYESLNNDDIYVQSLTRITDKEEITRPVFSSDGKDYTYSWFKGEIDLENIPNGDYKLYIVTLSDDYYSQSIISNKVLREQVSSYTAEKTVTTRNNYLEDEIPLELIVREEKIGDKNATSTYNQFNQYRALEFTNNKLHIKGTSYSSGMNLASSEKVERTIVFENTSTYKKYKYDLGSITDGMYKVGATLNDNLDKTRAWFDNKIDISNIPKGNYAIYITNKANINDFGELNEVIQRDVSSVKAVINNKKYSFSVNKNKRYRIELNVE